MKTFQYVCFHILMVHHGQGIEHAHPLYITEKEWMLEPENHPDCFLALDEGNQQRVLTWCEKSGVEIPVEIVDYMERRDAEMRKMRKMVGLGE